MKKENGKKSLDEKVRDRVLTKALEIHKESPDQCWDFRIMTSPMRKGALILRWTTVNIENIENPVQCFRYQCFQLDGSPQNCSVYYSNQEEANAFFFGLETLYGQLFANDHLI